MLNAVLVLMLTTSILGPVLTERFAPRLATAPANSLTTSASYPKLLPVLGAPIGDPRSASTGGPSVSTAWGHVRGHPRRAPNACRRQYRTETTLQVVLPLLVGEKSIERLGLARHYGTGFVALRLL